MKKIAITMGEPGGVGPEVIVKALQSGKAGKKFTPIVIGNADVMREAVKMTGLPVRIRTVSDISGIRTEPGHINVLDIRSHISAKKCAPSKSAGSAIIKYIEKAVELAQNNEIFAIVTAPISKESLNMAEAEWPGHTEMLADFTNTKNFAMMFASKKLNVILSTIHISLKDVPKKINEKLVLSTIRLAKKGAGMLGVKEPKIAVAGLNPHAGESGIMGTEETKAITPAINKARKEGINASGPYPPDVVFHKALNKEFDMIVCMYHDQGLIPFKMLAFETGVNVTVGLPIIRTSPDHGTAFDIAWNNNANPSSMIEAIKLAARMKLNK
jgi:4-hydroxythreonine-4-phosphate dehydrogenase